MKKLITLGIIVLFIGLVYAPSINANIGESEINPLKETIPLELQYQKIIDKIKSINLQKLLFDIDTVVDTFGEVSTALEENEDLRLYAQMQSDCGCEGTTKWPFPVICILLFPPFLAFILGLVLYKEL